MAPDEKRPGGLGRGALMFLRERPDHYRAPPSPASPGPIIRLHLGASFGTMEDLHAGN